MLEDTSDYVQCVECPRLFLPAKGKRGPKSSRCPICLPPRGRTIRIASFFTCQYCGLIEEKPGLRGPMPATCSGCAAQHIRQRIEANAEATRDRNRNYYLANRDRLLAVSRQWRAEHPNYDQEQYWKNVEYNRERSRRRRIDNPEYWPKYYAANREKIMAKTAEYDRRYPSNKKKSNAKRNQRRRIGEDAVFVDPMLVFRRDNWICGICKKPVDPQKSWPDPECAEMDHIVPLALGGPHTYENTQCAHKRCNAKKGARLQPVEASSNGNVDLAS